VEVRRLTAQDDLDAVACLYAQSWKASYRGLLPDAFLNRLTPDRWSAMLHADPGASLGLFVDGALTGTAMVGFARQAGREGYGEIISGNTQQENFGGQSARLYEYTRDLP